MANTKVAFQGEMGAYSHIDSEEFFIGALIKACPTFEETFKTAYDNEESKIIVPIENSLAGRVADIHYLLPESGLYIIREHFQKVNHCLLAKKGSKINDLKNVYSHIQALSQCRKNLNKLLIQINIIKELRDFSSNFKKYNKTIYIIRGVIFWTKSRFKNI